MWYPTVQCVMDCMLPAVVYTGRVGAACPLAQRLTVANADTQQRATSKRSCWFEEPAARVGTWEIRAIREHGMYTCVLHHSRRLISACIARLARRRSACLPASCMRAAAPHPPRHTPPQLPRSGVHMALLSALNPYQGLLRPFQARQLGACVLADTALERARPCTCP